MRNKPSELLEDGWDGGDRADEQRLGEERSEEEREAEAQNEAARALEQDAEAAQQGDYWREVGERFAHFASYPGTPEWQAFWTDVDTMLRPKLERFIKRKCFTYAVPIEESESVVQTTFSDMFLSAARYDPTKSFPGWVYTIAARRFFDHLRKRKSRPPQVPIADGDDRSSEAGRRPEPADPSGAEELIRVELNVQLQSLTPACGELVYKGLGWLEAQGKHHYVVAIVARYLPMLMADDYRFVLLPKVGGKRIALPKEFVNDRFQMAQLLRQHHQAEGTAQQGHGPDTVMRHLSREMAGWQPYVLKLDPTLWQQYRACFHDEDEDEEVTQ